jgi:hypothetical protein
MGSVCTCGVSPQKRMVRRLRESHALLRRTPQQPHRLLTLPEP